MLSIRKSTQLLGLTLIVLITSHCTSTYSEYTPLVRVEPAIDSEHSRAPRTLRLYFDALPDVSKSSLSLTGPAGEYSMRGMHTMAADDLMIEILEPLTIGDYTVNWTTVVGSDSSVYQGSFKFSVVD